MAEPTLDSIVSDAIKDQGTDKGTITAIETAVVETNETEDKPTEDKTVGEEKTPALDDVEKVQSEQLFQALKDPSKAPIIIRFLAEQVGLLSVKDRDIPQTRAEEKVVVAEATDDVLSVLKEGLGEQFDFLADKLAPAIDKIVKSQIQKQTEDIRLSIAQREEEKVQQQAAESLTFLAKKHYDSDNVPDDVLSEMSKMMDKVPPSKDLSVKDYTEFIYYSVVGRKGNTTADVAKKVSNNRSDAPSRLASVGGKQPVATIASTKIMSLDEAVKTAIEAVTKG